MEESNIQLTFKCPVKWNNLPASADGRYCAVCKKNVKDFAAAKTDEITNDVIEKQECGSFKATQLYRPFGDKRDVLIGYYQMLNKNRSSRKVLFMLVTAVLFITGCHSRRLSGAYETKYPKQSGKKHTVLVDQRNKGTYAQQ